MFCVCVRRAENIYEEYDQFRAVINSSGTVHWEPGGVFKTMCVIDITYYPFDDQTCRLTFGAWSYHTAKMNLTNMFDAINLDSYSVSHFTLNTSRHQMSILTVFKLLKHFKV